MTLIGAFFLIAGYFADDMWFPMRHHGASPPGTTPGLHHWEADPVGYLMAAMMWVLVAAVGVILFAQGVRGRTTLR